MHWQVRKGILFASRPCRRESLKVDVWCVRLWPKCLGYYCRYGVFCFAFQPKLFILRCDMSGRRQKCKVRATPALRSSWRKAGNACGRGGDVAPFLRIIVELDTKSKRCIV